MPDTKSGGQGLKKDGTPRKERISIIYLDCLFCGERKKDDKMANRFWCTECYRKQS